jgi:hypothetical protein
MNWISSRRIVEMEIGETKTKHRRRIDYSNVEIRREG